MDGRLLTARSLALDEVAAEVTAALGEAGVPAVLLKGSALATWLYGDGTLRPYGDVDLLVPPDDYALAGRILAALGFAAPPARLSRLEEARRGACPRLARTRLLISIDGSRASVEPAVAWRVLAESTETIGVGGGRVQVLGQPGRLLHVALHAAQHGPTVSKPRRDLARALAQVPLPVWEEAAQCRHRRPPPLCQSSGWSCPAGARRAWCRPSCSSAGTPPIKIGATSSWA